MKKRKRSRKNTFNGQGVEEKELTLHGGRGKEEVVSRINPESKKGLYPWED